MDIEMTSMKIIAFSGDARTFAFQALESVKKAEYQNADDLMKESNLASIEAHKIQTDLLINEANGNKNEINVLLIHAQDHLMTSMLAIELIKEIILLYKNH